jgi:HTH-type transcriptional regulator / antitoxin HigA
MLKTVRSSSIKKTSHPQKGRLKNKKLKRVMAKASIPPKALRKPSPASASHKHSSTQVSKSALSPRGLDTFPVQLLQSWDAFYGVAEGVFKPIKTEADYLAKLELVDALWDLTEGEDDPRMELIRWLLKNIAEWEGVHEAPHFTDVAGHLILKSLMEEHGITQLQLEQEGLMQQSLASKILRGERSISKVLAKRLGKRFHISPAVFI